MVHKFVLVNTVIGESVAHIELDSELLTPDIIDMESLTLKPLKGGGAYTLVPYEIDPKDVLNKIKISYMDIQTKPCPSLYEMLNRTDNFVELVGLLFKDIEFILIDSISDLELLINQADSESTLKKVKRSVVEQLGV